MQPVEEIDEVRRAVDRMKMEELALEGQEDPASKERLERLRASMADRQEQLNALVARWEQEKARLNKVGELKKRLDDLEGQAERAQRDEDYEAASRLVYGEIPAVKQQLAEVINAARSTQNAARSTQNDGTGAAGIPATAPLVKEVGPEDVAGVVSARTGIPAGRLLEGETGELHSQEQAGSGQITSEQPTIAGHAFMSYIRENSAEADRLQQVLEAAGVHVWRDTADLWPGQDWHERCRAIIKDSLVFLACFSTKSVSREILGSHVKGHAATRRGDRWRPRRWRCYWSGVLPFGGGGPRCGGPRGWRSRRNRASASPDRGFPPWRPHSSR